MLFEKLDESFLLLNRSCIVSVRHIQSIHQKKELLSWKMGWSFKMPRRKVKEICDEIERKREIL